MPKKTDPLSAVIVGAGLMGRWHAHAAVKAGARVSAIIDMDISAAKALAAEFVGSDAYTSVSTMTRHADVAHVCTPVDTHADMAGLLLDAGVHVLVEKPVAATLTETQMLLDKAAQRGRLICAVHQFPFQRGVRNAANAVAELGVLLHFESIICSAGASTDSARDDLVDNVLPHPLSLLSSFFNGPITGIEWQVLRPIPGELRVTSQFNGATISILVSTRGRPTANSVNLICERGTIAIDLFHGFSTVEQGGVSRTRKALRPIVRSGATIVAAVANLAVRAARGEPAFPGLDELTARFYEAVSSGRDSPISAEHMSAIALVRDRILTAGPRA